MQDYIDIAKKNGVTLFDEDSCQFCNAKTSRGINECIEIFSLGFELIDYSKPENQLYRFLNVDAHSILERGTINTISIINNSKNERDCKALIRNWGNEVYSSWKIHHKTVDAIATNFIAKFENQLFIEQ